MMMMFKISALGNNLQDTGRLLKCSSAPTMLLITNIYTVNIFLVLLIFSYASGHLRHEGSLWHASYDDLRSYHWHHRQYCADQPSPSILF
ncbi:hypothetical protein PAXRUDRAFT_606686 [Paxillus rubicundulus Ve08.2h10]|uniref:Uncharacterized protein n=1 Tax=Paxillus rubicundulus Ve08.2h10 TaxID=930991 RepID=A0A0D0DL10_9AGAM|nr:hypothetical protein PAXRUDRAFT_606686 [Paxillus rubicundulus Ve08.2h10]